MSKYFIPCVIFLLLFDFSYCTADSVYDATTFAICEYVDAEGIMDEVISSNVEVVLRGYFNGRATLPTGQT